MNKKKVLLVGGAGYIGGLTCDYLIEDGFDLTFIAVKHTNLNLNKANSTSALIFDTTSSIPSAISL